MSVWAFPEHNDFGISWLAAGVCGIGYSLVTAGHPGWLMPAAVGALGTWAAVEGAHRWTAQRNSDDVPDPGMADGFAAYDPYADVPPSLMEHGQLHKSVQALIDVAQARWPEKLVPVFERFEFDAADDGGRKLAAYTFRATEAGFLDERRATAIRQAFAQKVKGHWKFEVDTEDETISASQRSEIVKLAFPPCWSVVRDTEEAKDRYTSWNYIAGEGEDGQVAFSPNTFPHALIVGGSGGGKSVAGLAWIEQYRSSGWLLIFGDGKGSDYAGYAGVPGVLAIGRGSGARAIEYLAAVKLAFDIMTDRQDSAAERKLADPSGWNRFTPVLLVLDEIKSVLKKWRSGLSSSDFKKAVGMVDQILALGREMRVHVLCLTQDVYDESIPGSWVSNISLKVNIGVPHHKTLEKAFPETIRGRVQMLGDSMDQSVKGRCLVGAFDEDTGAAAVVEYQGYLSYAPGMSWDNPKIPKQAKDHWPQFKAEVSDRVPHMYSRQWFVLENKSAEQQAVEKKRGDLGFIDLEMYTYDELCALERVALDERKPDGSIGPRADTMVYDPDIRNPLYRGKKPAKAADKVIAETL